MPIDQLINLSKNLDIILLTETVDRSLLIDSIAENAISQTIFSYLSVMFMDDYDEMTVEELYNECKDKIKGDLTDRHNMKALLRMESLGRETLEEQIDLMPYENLIDLASKLKFIMNNPKKNIQEIKQKIKDKLVYETIRSIKNPIQSNNLNSINQDKLMQLARDMKIKLNALQSKKT